MDSNSSRRELAPAANPAAGILGALLGLVLVGLAVVAARDLMVDAGWLSGAIWSRQAIGWADGITWQGWMWPAAIGAIVVGVVFLLVGVSPRRKDHVRVDAGMNLWTRRVDIARRCSRVAADAASAPSASTVVRRRRVTVTLNGGDEADAPAVRDAVAEVLDGIGLNRRVVVKHSAKPTKEAAR